MHEFNVPIGLKLKVPYHAVSAILNENVKNIHVSYDVK